jgi:hypothetical protein
MTNKSPTTHIGAARMDEKVGYNCTKTDRRSTVIFSDQHNRLIPNKPIVQELPRNDQI